METYFGPPLAAPRLRSCGTLTLTLPWQLAPRPSVAVKKIV